MDESKIRIISKRNAPFTQEAQENITQTLTKNSDRLVKVQLLPLEVGFGQIYENENGSVSFKDAILHERKTQGGSVVVVLVLRRSVDGHDHAIQLTEDLGSALGKKIAMFSVVGKREDDLLEYHRKCSRLPIYQDQKWAVGQALGGESTKPKVMKMFSSKQKNGKNDPICDFSRNCLLIFDKKARLRFAYSEDASEKLSLDSILTAIRFIRFGVNSGKSNKSDESSCSSISSLESNISAHVSKDERRTTMSTVGEEEELA